MKLGADIGGLRALAFVPVFVSHDWPALLPGGFVGADAKRQKKILSQSLHDRGDNYLDTRRVDSLGIHHACSLQERGLMPPRCRLIPRKNTKYIHLSSVEM